MAAALSSVQLRATVVVPGVASPHDQPLATSRWIDTLAAIEHAVLAIGLWLAGPRPAAADVWPEGTDDEILWNHRAQWRVLTIGESFGVVSIRPKEVEAH